MMNINKLISENHSAINHNFFRKFLKLLKREFVHIFCLKTVEEFAKRCALRAVWPVGSAHVCSRQDGFLLFIHPFSCTDQSMGFAHFPRVINPTAAVLHLCALLKKIPREPKVSEGGMMLTPVILHSVLSPHNKKKCPIHCFFSSKISSKLFGWP